MSDRCVLVSNHRYCSQPDWGLVILLAKVLVQSILQSPDVAMQQCPEPDVLERCPAGRRRSFLTCVWSLAEPSASAGHPGSMHHLPLLRVQQRTVCAAQLRDCCGYHDRRSVRSAAGARYQPTLRFFVDEDTIGLIWALIGCTTVNTFSYVNQLKLTDDVLWKLVQKLLASFQARVLVGCCQLLWTTLFETLQLQIFLDNLNLRCFVYFSFSGYSGKPFCEFVTNK